MNQVQVMKARLHKITMVSAEPGEIAPEGISRTAVRGFCASKRRSIKRLKAMAALRANTMHRITKIKVSQLNCAPPERMAKQKPMSAKGSANTVWLNLMSERYFFTMN